MSGFVVHKSPNGTWEVLIRTSTSSESLDAGLPMQDAIRVCHFMNGGSAIKWVDIRRILDIDDD